MEHMIGDARAKGRKGLILTYTELIHCYEKFGYKTWALSASLTAGQLVRYAFGI